jgi:glycosyltransferase involved in cell wall biosynthesis
MASLCLNMIVRNEAHIIRRCLDAVRPFIDSWVIVDTGSTDGTQELIRSIYADLPGQLHERPWKDFGHNRTEAIELARGQADYIFVIDADEVLRLPPGFRRPALTARGYSLTFVHGSVVHKRTCIVSARAPWRYVGVLHEYLDCGEPEYAPLIPGPEVVAIADGARSQRSQAEKYSADAEVLEAALRMEPGNARYVYYLAQSYRDSGQKEKALDCYDRRAAMGGWQEEAWSSMYNAALLAEQVGSDEAEILRRYLDAIDARPGRAEAYGDLARFFRLRRKYALARIFAERGMGLPPTEDILFVNVSFQQWRCADEYAVASYWVGDHAACKRVCEALLDNPALPPEDRPRILGNLGFAQIALQGSVQGR